jgi:hypothetical protein
MPSPTTPDSPSPADACPQGGQRRRGVSPARRSRGAPRGNKNRQTHGVYAAPPASVPPGGAPITSIDDLVNDALRRHTDLGAFIDAHAGELDADTLMRLFALHGQNASRLGRLLRDKRALSGQAADGLLAAIAAALDEISTELGVTL